MLARMVWRDGAFVSASEATISVHAHPMQRGSLVFDVLSFHRTPRGPAVFRLREHVTRFLRSMSIVGLVSPFDEQTLSAATLAMVGRSGLDDGLIRISGFVPTLEADLVPADPTGSVTIVAYARDDLAKKTRTPSALRIHVPRDVRKAAPDAIPPLAKVAAAYLGPMLARRRALEGGFDEVVLLDHEGTVAEAPTANVFAFVEGALVTPSLGKILDGITRDAVMAIARDEGIEVVERRLTADELRDADEAFLTATSYAVAPIASVDGAALRGGAPGAVTMRIRGRFTRILAGDDPRSAAWLTFVSAQS